MSNPVAVLCIDGPSGSGKGTVAARLARALGWHLLDSGALYRLTALSARRAGLDFTDVGALADCAAGLDIHFEPGADASASANAGAHADANADAIVVRLAGEDVSRAIRSDEVGQDASRVAAVEEVRAALIDRQRAFRTAPGLVADGRDMGTVVFTEAPLKIYLTASVQARADRRYKQLMDKGLPASLRDLFDSIQARDDRDINRAIAPLKPADDAVAIDSTSLNADAVFERVMTEARSRGLVD